jgi:hypothetical protein
MAFKAVFIAHAPDADFEKDHNLIDQTSLKAVFYLDILSKRKNLPFIRQSKLFI